MIDGMKNIVAFVTIVDRERGQKREGNANGGLHEVLHGRVSTGGCLFRWRSLRQSDHSVAEIGYCRNTGMTGRM